jgi:hypothetical protein
VRNERSGVTSWRQRDHGSLLGREVGDTRFGATLLARWASNQTSGLRAGHGSCCSRGSPTHPRNSL